MDPTSAKSSKEDLLSRLRNPINVSESSENLHTPEQTAKRQEILQKDIDRTSSVEAMTDELIGAI